MVFQSFPCSICRLSEADYWPLMNNPLPLFRLPVVTLFFLHNLFCCGFSLIFLFEFISASHSLWILLSYLELTSSSHSDLCFLLGILIASLLCGNTTVFIIVSSLFGSSFRFFLLGIVSIQFKFFGKGIFLFLFFLVCVCVCIYVSFLAGTCTSEVVCWFSHFFL